MAEGTKGGIGHPAFKADASLGAISAIATDGDLLGTAGVNRKKQKRRQKQAAKQAAAEEAVDTEKAPASRSYASLNVEEVPGKYDVGLILLRDSD
jgi:hypothetical protein